MTGFIKKLTDGIKRYNNIKRLKKMELDCSRREPSKIYDYPGDMCSEDDIDIFGTSVCGDTTSIQTEGGTIGFDAGKSIKNLPIPDHLSISHYHYDHFGGLPAVGCKTIDDGKEVNVYLHEDIPNTAKEIIDKFSEINPEHKLNIHYVKDGDRIQIDDDTFLEFFDTNHCQGSMGTSLLKKDENGELVNRITYPGDINIRDEKMRSLPRIRDAKNLIIESSYFGNKISDFLYDNFRHTSFREVNKFTDELHDLESVTYMHIPYSQDIMQPCKYIDKSVQESNTKNAGYIPTCMEGEENPLIPKLRKRIK